MKKLISSLMAGIFASTLSVAAMANTPPQNEKMQMNQQVPAAQKMDKKSAPAQKQMNKKHQTAKAKKHQSTKKHHSKYKTHKTSAKKNMKHHNASQQKSLPKQPQKQNQPG